MIIIVCSIIYIICAAILITVSGRIKIERKYLLAIAVVVGFTGVFPVIISETIYGESVPVILKSLGWSFGGMVGVIERRYRDNRYLILPPVPTPEAEKTIRYKLRELQEIIIPNIKLFLFALIGSYIGAFTIGLFLIAFYDLYINRHEYSLLSIICGILGCIIGIIIGTILTNKFYKRNEDKGLSNLARFMIILPFCGIIGAGIGLFGMQLLGV